MSNEAIEILVVGTFNAKVTAANVVDGLIVHHEAAVRVLESGMSSQDRVVWLNHRCGNLWSWIDTEFELALLAIVNRQSFHEKRTEPGTSTTSKRVEDE